MNCITIDDEKTARVIIKKLCEQHGGLNVIEEFPNAMQAIKYLNKNTVNCIFLDIHMPDFSGFDFIETLKKQKDHNTKIILTTSDPNFAIEAFEYECIVAYLVKPILQPNFEKAIKKVEKALALKPTTANETTEDSTKELYVNIDRRLVKIDFSSIYLIEAKGDYINIKTENKNYIVHSTLKKIEEKLPKDLFLKVHRSYVINIKKIVDIEDNSVLIKRDVIPVSRSNRAELMKRLNLL